jgi:hypothetical protein
MRRPSHGTLLVSKKHGLKAEDKRRCVMRCMRFVALLTVSVILVVFVASLCVGQSNLASISGLVRDPQGAVIPEASVTATNVATGVPARTVTDSAGFYSIPSLPVGTYTLTVEHSGFRRYIRQGIVLTTGRSLGLNICLSISAAFVRFRSEEPQSFHIFEG